MMILLWPVGNLFCQANLNHAQHPKAKTVAGVASFTPVSPSQAVVALYFDMTYSE
jgi:hypothetical protein